MDKCRVDGSRVVVAEVEVGDSTGAVSLRVSTPLSTTFSRKASLYLSLNY